MKLPYAIIILVLAGCSSGMNSQIVECVLPELPVEWSDLSWNRGCRLCYRSDNGEIEECSVSTCSDSVSLILPKGVNLPVLAYLEGTGIPSGAVIPWDMDEAGRLELSWEDGWVAELLLHLSSSVEMSEALNVRRLQEEVLLKSNGDPWKLDMVHALHCLSFGRFSIYSLVLSPDHELSLTMEQGDWIPDNPFREPIRVSDEGILFFPSLEEGFHSFRSGDGFGRLDLYITEKEWYALDRVRGIAVSGIW